MKISIVVPVYKVEDCLKRCVDSLIHQTYRNIEIILVDDGSPDSCGEMCDQFQKEDGRILVIHQENRGLSEARNAGIQKSTGDYIMLVDSDDYIETDACEKIAPFLTSGADMVLCDCDVTRPGYSYKHYAGLEVGREYSGAHYMKEALSHKSFPVMAWLNLYRKEFLMKNGLLFKKGILHEDTEFTPRALLKANRVIYTGIVFYHYIINDTSITSNKNKSKHCKDIYDTCLSYDVILKDLEDKELRSLLENFFVGCYLSIFRAGNMYKFGKKYVHKKYVLTHAHSAKNILKALLFTLSPKLLCVLKQ